MLNIRRALTGAGVSIQEFLSCVSIQEFLSSEVKHSWSESKLIVISEGSLILPNKDICATDIGAHGH